MLSMKRVIPVILLSFLTQGTCFSQSGNLVLRGGFATVKGETSEGMFKGDYGYDISLSYILTLTSEEWMLTAEFANSSYEPQLNFNMGVADSNFQAQVAQNFLGIGFRRYLTRSINSVNPYPGQLLPYLGINFGCVKNEVDIIQIGALPSAYRTRPETTYQMAFQFEAGLDVALGAQWCIHSYLSLRTGRTDNWDGLSGRGYGSDWLLRGGLGILYRL